MARGTKEHFSKVSMAELLEDLKIEKSSFDERFKKFCEVYNFDTNYNLFKKDPENPRTEFEFSWEWYPLFRAFIKAIPSHPFYRKNTKADNITINRTNAYQNELISEIESMPNHLKYEIMSHSAFQSTLKELLASKNLSCKISEAVTAIELISQSERSDIMIEIFKQLDNWIFTAFKNNYAISTAKSANRHYIQDILEEMARSSHGRSTEEKKVNSELINHLKNVEEYKKAHIEQSRLDFFMVFLLKRHINQDKLPKPEGNLSPKQKVERFNREEKMRNEKQHLYRQVAQLNAPDETNKNNDIELFRNTLELVLERMNNVTDEKMEHFDETIGKIKSTPYVKSTMEHKILEEKSYSKTIRPEEKSEARRKMIEERRAYLTGMIKALENELEKMEDLDYVFPYENQLLLDIQQRYLDFSRIVRSSSNKHHLSASETFIGQLISTTYNPNSD